MGEKKILGGEETFPAHPESGSQDSSPKYWSSPYPLAHPTRTAPAPRPPAPPARPPRPPPGFWYLNNPVRPLYTWFRVYNLQLYSSLASGCVGLRVEVCCHCLAPPPCNVLIQFLACVSYCKPDHSMAQPNIRHPRSFRSFWPPDSSGRLHPWPATSFEPRLTAPAPFLAALRCRVLTRPRL